MTLMHEQPFEEQAVEAQARTLIRLVSAGGGGSAACEECSAVFRLTLSSLLREIEKHAKFPGIWERTKEDAWREVCEDLLEEILAGRFAVRPDGAQGEQLIDHDGAVCSEGFREYALRRFTQELQERLTINALALKAILGESRHGEWESLYNLLYDTLYRRARNQLYNFPGESDEVVKDVVQETWTVVVNQIRTHQLDVGAEGAADVLIYRGDPLKRGFTALCHGVLRVNIRRLWRESLRLPKPLDADPPEPESDTVDAACIAYAIGLIGTAKHRVALGAWYMWEKYENMLSATYLNKYDYVIHQVMQAGFGMPNRNTVYSWVRRGLQEFKQHYEHHCLSS